ncbi:amidase [Granulicella sp. L46]|uniref:amidase n=1 Tax=Granulicella sp. L46 TaxID=1641865 RepID=UPI00131B4677|nr:amidase [Granulicella sp. L46]
MSDLLTQPAVDLVALLAAQKISAFELAELHIERIEQLNPQLNALVDFDPDEIRRQAIMLDQSTAPRGPLHGLPLTVKSSISVVGRLCETGSLFNQGRRPTSDAETVTRLRKAGALILGTTNCPEFLMAYETDNRLYGRTSNPWDLTRTAGGSSGGESAAIAAGLSAGGLGSDGGGSVREPAHFTGICAMKPTPGRIPTAGHLPDTLGPFALLGTIGPMARTMADVTLLFRVVSGALDIDPVAAPVPYRPSTAEALKTIRIGYFEDDGLVPVTAETRQAVQDAVHSLRRHGFHVEAFRPPSLERARELWYTYFVRCGALLLEPLGRGRESDLSPTFLDFLSTARAHAPLAADELLGAWRETNIVRSQLLVEMRDFPILLSPVCSIPAFRHGERNWTLHDANGTARSLAYLDAMRFTQWFNLLGAPAAVVPISRSAEGLPIGLQLAGRPYGDEDVLGIASILEEDFGYVAPPAQYP